IGAENCNPPPVNAPSSANTWRRHFVPDHARSAIRPEVHLPTRKEELMKRRNFLLATPASIAATSLGLRSHAAAQPAPLQVSQEKSGLKITSVRLVRTRPKRPLPVYKPTPSAW